MDTDVSVDAHLPASSDANDCRSLVQTWQPAAMMACSASAQAWVTRAMSKAVRTAQSTLCGHLQHETRFHGGTGKVT